MRRLFFFISYFLIFSFSFSLYAQVGKPRTDLAIGGGGGFVMNTVSFSPSIKQTLKNGMTMGVTARYTCEKYFNMICAFQGEINYSQAGWKEGFDDGRGGRELVVIVHALQDIRLVSTAVELSQLRLELYLCAPAGRHLAKITPEVVEELAVLAAMEQIVYFAVHCYLMNVLLSEYSL